MPILDFIDDFVFEKFNQKLQILWPVAKQPVLLWQPFCGFVPHSLGVVLVLVPSMNLIKLTVAELRRLQFSIDHQLKVPIFTFLGVKGVKLKISLF